jgi:hypothetical protein
MFMGQPMLIPVEQSAADVMRKAIRGEQFDRGVLSLMFQRYLNTGAKIQDLAITVIKKSCVAYDLFRAQAEVDGASVRGAIIMVTHRNCLARMLAAPAPKTSERIANSKHAGVMFVLLEKDEAAVVGFEWARKVAQA